MWKHFCRRDKNVISIGENEDCSWCGKTEPEVKNYPGRFWLYPAKRFADWPESEAYYHDLTKNIS